MTVRMLLHIWPKTSCRELNWPKTTCSDGLWSHSEIHKFVCDIEQHCEHLQEASFYSSVWIKACEITNSQGDEPLIWGLTCKRQNLNDLSKGGLCHLLQFLQSQWVIVKAFQSKRLNRKQRQDLYSICYILYMKVLIIFLHRIFQMYFCKTRWKTSHTFWIFCSGLTAGEKCKQLWRTPRAFCLHLVADYEPAPAPR